MFTVVNCFGSAELRFAPVQIVSLTYLSQQNEAE